MLARLATAVWRVLEQDTAVCWSKIQLCVLEQDTAVCWSKIQLCVLEQDTAVCVGARHSGAEAGLGGGGGEKGESWVEG